MLKPVANIPGTFTLEDDTKKIYMLRDEEKPKDQGAMGYVSSAVWMEGRSKKKVLLKRLCKPVNPNQEKLFSNEGFMSKDYGGGGIVKLYGKGETEEFLFMIMEFYEGQTLDKLITQGAFLGKIQNSCKLVLDILNALGDLHGSEVVHRDFKPANIIIRKNGKPKSQRSMVMTVFLMNRKNKSCVPWRKCGTSANRIWKSLSILHTTLFASSEKTI